jgi:hypothetical protein
MAEFEVGQSVKIPCDIQPGAFPDECLVTIKIDDGIISGFVKAKHLTRMNDATGYLQATVVDAQGGAVTVRMPGSFFTIAAGVTSVSEHWANKHLSAAA